mmetsp:Transcript_13795/g.29974  ORF Transcript_13795/g.29974 Transcript_13795/m.29974 type:complete len:210 (+) Transcript_13795:104-733(+)
MFATLPIRDGAIPIDRQSPPIMFEVFPLSLLAYDATRNYFLHILDAYSERHGARRRRIWVYVYGTAAAEEIDTCGHVIRSTFSVIKRFGKAPNFVSVEIDFLQDVDVHKMLDKRPVEGGALVTRATSLNVIDFTPFVSNLQAHTILVMVIFPLGCAICAIHSHTFAVVCACHSFDFTRRRASDDKLGDINVCCLCVSISFCCGQYLAPF